MTNREFLNSMSDEGLASFMQMFDCPPDCAEDDSEIPCADSCSDCWVRWLKLEHEPSSNRVGWPDLSVVPEKDPCYGCSSLRCTRSCIPYKKFHGMELSEEEKQLVCIYDVVGKLIKEGKFDNIGVKHDDV